MKNSDNEKIYNNLTEIIGNTPLLCLNGFCKKFNIKSKIIAKLEYFNPLGSSKDRVGFALIEDAEKDGRLRKGCVIIEPTSGNTGIGLAYTSAIKGYRLILTMPENMSKERIRLLAALGAEIILTPEKEGMQGAIEKANEIASMLPDVFIPDQFSNKSNTLIHKKTTAREILRDTDCNIDFFVAGVGTGGTVTGIGEVLKEELPDVKIIAVEPYSSAVLSGESKGSHGIMGIGAGFIPEIINVNILDRIIKVTEEQAFTMARAVARTDGLLVGISSGAVLYAAKMISEENPSEEKRIVVLFPDSGERYLSTQLYSN